MLSSALKKFNVFLAAFSFSCCVASAQEPTQTTSAPPQTESQSQRDEQPAAGQSGDNINKEDAAGEFFSVPVSMSNYKFARWAAMFFGRKWGSANKTDQEIEERTWTDLLLSYEAYQRGITISPEELDTEITNILSDNKVAFDWKKDKEAYEAWVKEKIRGPVELFKNQVEYLLQINKLRDDIIKNAKIEITDQDLKGEFDDVNNSINLDLKEFEDPAAAGEFYKDMKKEPGVWLAEKKKDDKYAKELGMVTIQFLNQIWKIPREDLYKMIKMDDNSIYPPSPIYKGYGVFRIIGKRPADPNEFAKQKEYLTKVINDKKSLQAFDNWYKEFKEKANIKIFVKPEEKPEEKAQTPQKEREK